MSISTPPLISIPRATPTPATPNRVSSLLSPQDREILERDLVMAVNNNLQDRYGPALRNFVRRISIQEDQMFASVRMSIRIAESYSPSDYTRTANPRFVSIVIQRAPFSHDEVSLDLFTEHALAALETNARQVIEEFRADYNLTNSTAYNQAHSPRSVNEAFRRQINFTERYRDYNGDDLMSYPRRFTTRNTPTGSITTASSTTGATSALTAETLHNIWNTSNTSIHAADEEAMSITGGDFLNNYVNIATRNLGSTANILGRSGTAGSFVGTLSSSTPPPSEPIPSNIDALLKALFERITVETTLSLNGDELECSVKLTASLSNDKQISTEVISDSVIIEREDD